MSTAAALRLQIETALQARIPGALTPRPRTIREVVATGIPSLDDVLGGGLPLGAISEVVGPHCSGRTTLAMALLAELTQAGKSVAWVDTSDALDPESAAAAGVDLSRQLWVRCGQETSPGAFASIPETVAGHASGAALLVEGSRTAAPTGGCGSPHPRGEARGMSQAVDAFLQPDVFSRPAPPRDPAVPRRNRMVGTPSAPNRKLTDRVPYDPRPFPRRAKDREEQVPTDRRPTRRQLMHGAAEPGPHNAKTLQAAQISNTALAAKAREAQKSNGAPGAWTDNRNNAAGRCLATPPNAIAAGLPRFREMEARAAGQGHGLPQNPMFWKPSLETMHVPAAPGSSVPPGHAKTPAPGTTAPARDQELTASKSLKTHEVTSLLGERPAKLGRRSSPLWHALDQALRATDLLLAAGGFSAVVLDLANVPPDFAWRIPLATWFRFRAAADRARAVLLLLTPYACARSSAGLVLRVLPAEIQDATHVLTGARFRVAVDRRRFETGPEETLAQPARAPFGAQHAYTQPSAGEPLRDKLHLVTARKPPQTATTGATATVGAHSATVWSRGMAWSPAPAQMAEEASRSSLSRTGSAR